MEKLQRDELEVARRLLECAIRERLTNPGVAIIFAFTSNLISCGVREAIAFLCRHHLVDAVISTAGGIEEDMIKCLGETYLGDFFLDGTSLRKKGLNRIGNLLVPNNNYCAFDQWIMPLLDNATEVSRIWGGGALVRYLGLALNDPRSVATCAARSGIPFVCPALTDGSIGDMLYFHSLRADGGGIIVDPAADSAAVATALRTATKAVGIFLGAGSPMHMACGLAARTRGGFDSIISVCTATPGDASVAAMGDDALRARGWLRGVAGDGAYARMRAEASIVFPELMVTAVVPVVAERAAAAAKAAGATGSAADASGGDASAAGASPVEALMAKAVAAGKPYAPVAFEYGAATADAGDAARAAEWACVRDLEHAACFE